MSKLANVFRRLKNYHNNNNDRESIFSGIWKQHNQIKDGEELILNVFSEIQESVKTKDIDAKKIATEALAFYDSYKKTKDLKKTFLLEIYDLMVCNFVPDRYVLRSVLQKLYFISKTIDRKVLFFDQAENARPVKVDSELLTKQEYVLDHISAWKLDIPKQKKFFSSCFYLDLPLKRVAVSTDSNVMAEALYRQQDPDFVLRLLQSGIYPSCVYLWPICILVDLKCCMSRIEDQDDPYNEVILASREVTMIRYFCRVRHYIHVEVVNPEDKGDSFENIPDGLHFDDVLLVPPKCLFIVPENRYRYPSSLMHQCRLAIRAALIQADELRSSAFKQLPLPLIMKDYLNLLID